MAVVEVGLHCDFSVASGCCHQPLFRLSEIPNVLPQESNEAKDCQPVLDPHDLGVVVCERAPYQRSDPGAEIDLGVSTTVARVPGSESATDYELCGGPQQAFL